ncbi:MAG: 50S ribosomal protein L33 [Deltaproteobacteria bacterium]|nr:50S ribosomal protein L33 [Deltaproteobacteria bacterium]
MTNGRVKVALACEECGARNYQTTKSGCGFESLLACREEQRWRSQKNKTKRGRPERLA